MSLYRFLSLLVSVLGAFIAAITLFSLFFALANPAALFQVFLFGCTVLYTWFANKFRKTVIDQQRGMTRRQKDWLQVNAIVAFIFAVLGITNSIYIFTTPAILDDLIKALPVVPPGMDLKKLLYNFSIGLFIGCSILLAHIIWTYILVRKHHDYFEA